MWGGLYNKMEIKYLLVGKSPYDSGKKGYGPLIMEEDEYPFKIAAFIPERKNESCLYKITTYRRIINLLHGEALECETFNSYSLYKDGGKDLVYHYMSKGVFFCNKDDLKKEHLTKGKLKKWSITKNTKIITFGSCAAKKLNEWEIDQIIYKMPHPSQKVNHPYWHKYDKDTNFVKHSSLEDVEKVTESINKGS